ncbi:unnamed protein product [Moneuplotes crassus]|uniref:PHR domain-containing protein n=1 Tax=Euplotes crassus TaxID=5936 RepID=A0AAD1UGU6_EUPCR|nr:unnamed protein product [Moneuplotes crassus]
MLGCQKNKMMKKSEMEDYEDSILGMSDVEKTINRNKYMRKKDLIWRTTLDEDIIPFTNLKPSLKELTQEEMKKNDAPDQFNFSEASLFRSFKAGSHPLFNKDKLIYNFKTNKWFKVLDLKTDNEYNPTWASLAIRDESETIEISDSEDFSQFKSTLKVFININFQEGESTVVEVHPKIYEKFETAFEDAFQGAGVSIESYKLFFKGKEVPKDDCIAKIDGIYDGSTILASEGVGKSHKFSRFPPINEMRSNWSNSGRSCDAVIFVPNQNIRVCGFSTYAATTDSQYEMKYSVTIDGTIVEEGQVTASGWEDKYFYRFKLEGVYPVKAGQKIDIGVWIAKNISSSEYVSTYAGGQGMDYEKVENEHMGLFKIEPSTQSRNGTSVYGGHLPEIFYYLG